MWLVYLHKNGLLKLKLHQWRIFLPRLRVLTIIYNLPNLRNLPSTLYHSSENLLVIENLRLFSDVTIINTPSSIYCPCLRPRGSSRMLVTLTLTLPAPKTNISLHVLIHNSLKNQTLKIDPLWRLRSFILTKCF